MLTIHSHFSTAAPRLDKTNLVFIHTENKIFCNVIGYPIPVFKWQYQFAVCLTENFLDCVPRNDKWVDLPGKHIVSTDTSLEKRKSTVTIPDSVHFGFYKCIVTNELGREANVLKFYGGGKCSIMNTTYFLGQRTTLSKCLRNKSFFISKWHQIVDHWKEA